MTDLWQEGRDQFEQDLRDRGAKEADIKLFLAEKATIQDAENSCQAIKQDADKKYGNIVIANQKVPTKWIGAVMSNMQRIMTVGDYMMKSAPESISLGWWAIKQVLGGIQNNYKLYGFFGSALADITDAMVVIATYDRLYNERNRLDWTASDIVQRLLKHIRSIYAAILDFSWSVRQHINGGTWSRFKHAFKDLINVDLNKFEDKMKSIEELKKKTKEVSGVAFQEKTFKQSDELQTLVVQVKQVQEENMRESRETKTYLMELMTDIRQSRPPSRMDWAKRKFEENKRTLAPLDEEGKPPNLLREEGTCGWIFEDDAYKAWQDSNHSSLLCLNGGSGTGKTFLAAAVFEKLESGSKHDKQPFVQYIDCHAARVSAGISRVAGRQEAKSTPGDRIQNTLISQVCDLIARKSVEEDDPTLLERCNEIFQHPKAKKSTSQNDTETIPAITEAYEKFESILGYEFYIILDSVEQLEDQQNKVFMTSLFELGQRKDLQFHVLVSTRAFGKLFTAEQRQSIPQISMEFNNGIDIKRLTRNKLDQMPGWSRAEKVLAEETVLEKAGSYFQYVNKVALPFLEQPWQRPLSNHLNRLPGGLEEMYEQAIRQMEPNYLGLLKNALIWILTAKRDPTPAEICEAYSGVYPVEEGSVSDEEEAPLTGRSDVFYEQILKAAGPFLDIGNQKDNVVVKLKDAVAVRKFCMPETLIEENQQSNSDALCEGCKTPISRSPTIRFSKKEAHLMMALIIMRHLNSRKFLKRFLPSALTSTSDATSNQQAEVQKISPTSEGDEIELGDHTSGDQEPIAQSESNPKKDDPSDIPKDNFNAVDSEKRDESNVDGTGNVETVDETVSSSDDESISTDSDWTHPSGELPPPPLPFDNDWRMEMRYELSFPLEHIGEAQALWTPEERRGNSEWQELIELVKSFIIESPEMFNAWQYSVLFKGLDRIAIRGLSTLQAACQTGLPEIAEIVLSQGEKLEGRDEFDMTPLFAAASVDHNHAMVRFLLDQGADPNKEMGMLTPFTLCLSENPVDLNLLREFFHKSDSRKPVSLEAKGYGGWSAMHWLAGNGSDRSALDLLVKNGGDVNILNDKNRSPLHLILDRREIPLDLLRGFIEHKANVTAEDNDSEMPLYKAAKEGEIGAIKLLIEEYTVEDIDDITESGQTAIHNAALAGHLAVVELLTDRGANIQILDKHNRTPFFLACQGNSEKVAMYLLDKYLEKNLSFDAINQPTRSRRTPFREAAAHGMLSVVERLLQFPDHKDIVNVADTRIGRNALHCAALRGHFKVVQLLLENGADINLKDGPKEEGLTALELCHNQWANNRTRKYEDIVLLLIDRNPPVAAQDVQLLVAATINNSRKVLEKLHAVGADLTQPDRYGWTPIILATRFHQDDARKYLEQQLKQVGNRPSSFEVDSEEIQLTKGGTILTASKPCDIFRLESIIANHPAPPGPSQYYWEITVKSMDGETPSVSIGFCNFHVAQWMTYPGWGLRRRGLRSWAYHGFEGSFATSINLVQKISGEPWKVGDTVGCGIDYDTNTIFFTRQGEKLDPHFDDVHGRVFPCLGIGSGAVCIEVNFGNNLIEKPFMWSGTETSHPKES